MSGPGLGSGSGEHVVALAGCGNGLEQGVDICPSHQMFWLLFLFDSPGPYLVDDECELEELL